MGLEPVHRLHELVVLLEDEAERLANARVVVDDQDDRAHGRSVADAAGATRVSGRPGGSRDPARRARTASTSGGERWSA